MASSSLTPTPSDTEEGNSRPHASPRAAPRRGERDGEGPDAAPTGCGVGQKRIPSISSRLRAPRPPNGALPDRYIYSQRRPPDVSIPHQRDG